MTPHKPDADGSAPLHSSGSSPTSPTSRSRLQRVQALSGLAFGVFLLVHLAALAASAFGAGLYDAVQGPTRAIYTLWPVELALLSALAVHVGVGFRLALLRRRSAQGSGPRPPLRVRLQRYSAYFLSLVMVGHIAATRVPDLLYDAAPGFDGLHFTMWYAPLIFYPYYLMLAVAGLYHLMQGSVVSLGRLRGPFAAVAGWLRPKRNFWLVFAVAAALCAGGWFSLGGGLYETPDPRRSDFARAGETLGVVEAGTALP